MNDESPRVQELRRRVQADPASIAFAQLAEECRRAGSAEEAVSIARAGLSYHPAYLSARVTLGRALIELGKLDEARDELTQVLNSAPDNLPAIRAMAEVHQQRGQLPDALEYYRRALRLAQFDPELESAVSRIESVVAPPAPKAPAAPAPTKVEDLFDFDTLLEQLGGRPSAAETQPPAPPVVASPSPLQQVELRSDDADPFALLEQQLREQDSAPERNRALDQELLDTLRAADDEAARREEEAREARRREEAARAEAERAEAARFAAMRVDAERREAERFEQQRREVERQDQLRLQQALADASRREEERREADRIEAVRLAEARREQRVLAELEHWLAAIEADRHHSSL